MLSADQYQGQPGITTLLQDRYLTITAGYRKDSCARKLSSALTAHSDASFEVSSGNECISMDDNAHYRHANFTDDFLERENI
ncbi:hypothetical protein TNCV_78911 [Trichonephila clavipes]|nr:hypothetical protein TNCV_78911 [Trichonephila clavipes]